MALRNAWNLPHLEKSEAARKLAKRDKNVNNAEDVVYSSFLVSAAREAGVDVDRLVKMPMISMKKDESVQVDLPCPDCVLLEMCEDINPLSPCPDFPPI